MSGSYGYTGNRKKNMRKRKRRDGSKKAVFRRQEQNRGSMFLVTFAVLIIVSVIFLGGLGLQKKIDAYNVRIKELTAEIQREEERALKLEEYRKYTQTKGFVEEMAQDQLGLVYKGEIIFKQD